MQQFWKLLSCWESDEYSEFWSHKSSFLGRVEFQVSKLTTLASMLLLARLNPPRSRRRIDNPRWLCHSLHLLPHETTWTRSAEALLDNHPHVVCDAPLLEDLVMYVCVFESRENIYEPSSFSSSLKIGEDFKTGDWSVHLILSKKSVSPSNVELFLRLVFHSLCWPLRSL